MNQPTFFGKSIRRRVELAAIIPVIIVILILTVLTIHNRMRDAGIAFDQVGTQTARYLASRAELPLFSGTYEDLERIMTHSDWPRDVAGLALLDPEQQPVMSSEGFPWPSQTPTEWHRHQKATTYRYYLQPVFFATIGVDDYQGDLAPARELAGYALIALDLSSARVLAFRILVNSLLFAFGALLLATALSRILANSITAPIRHYSQALQSLQQGHLETRVDITTQDELAILAQGINSLAQSVQEGQRNLQNNVDKATAQLKTAMDNLRQKNLELEQARAVAEQSAQAKGEFLARMSHELRTPLTAISGFLKLLETESLGLKERHYCTIIEQSTHQLLKHIDDILAFSRLSSNQVILDNAPFALDESLAAVVSQMRYTALEKNVELFIDIAPDCPLGRYGDSFRLYQIASNLVSNALKFTDHGWVEISAYNGEHDELCIEVRDTGIGIRPDRLADIFNPFAQGDTSTTRRFGGTGLGLPIVKNLVNLMGGEIHIESVVAEGTCIKIALPLPVCDDVPRPEPLDIHAALLVSDSALERAHGHAMHHCFTRLTLTADPNELFQPDIAQCDVLLMGLLIDPGGGLATVQEVIVANWPKPLIILSTPGAESQYFQQIIEWRGNRPLTLLSPTSIGNFIESMKQALAPPGSQSNNLQPHVAQEILAGMRFLIAEDNQFSRLLLEELITRHGGDFTSATNGYEALQHAQAEPYDLLLVDVHMPDLGGEESIRRIRTQGTLNRNTPIIVLTADVLQENQQALYEAGADALLFKPLQEKSLLKHIVELCRHPDRVDAIESQAQHEAPDTLLPHYRAELKRLLALCRETWLRSDEAELREILHQLLGVAGVFRRPELAEQAKRSHRRLREGGLEGFSAELETLAAMMEVEINAEGGAEPD